MIIRRATVEDVPSIAAIHRMSRALTMPWLPVLHSADDDRWFMANLVLPTQTVFVVETDVVVGFAAYADGWLHHLYVYPSAHRQGVGSKLMKMAKWKNPTLRLNTFRDNHGARAFYEHHGFVKVGETDGDNEENTPDVQLFWQS